MFETLTWAIEATTVGFVAVVLVIACLKVAITIKEEVKELVQ